MHVHIIIGKHLHEPSNVPIYYVKVVQLCADQDISRSDTACTVPLPWWFFVWHVYVAIQPAQGCIVMTTDLGCMTKNQIAIAIFNCS